MAAFHTLAAEIREDFEKIEDGFFEAGRALIAAPAKEKTEFMAECWQRAGAATERWIADLERRNFTIQHAGFRSMWDRFNRAAVMPWVQ
jgi:hypothetical protein